MIRTISPLFSNQRTVKMRLMRLHPSAPPPYYCSGVRLDRAWERWDFLSVLKVPWRKHWQAIFQPPFFCACAAANHSHSAGQNSPRRYHRKTALGVNPHFKPNKKTCTWPIWRDAGYNTFWHSTAPLCKLTKDSLGLQLFSAPLPSSQNFYFHYGFQLKNFPPSVKVCSKLLFASFATHRLLLCPPRFFLFLS